MKSQQLKQLIAEYKKLKSIAYNRGFIVDDAAIYGDPARFYKMEIERVKSLLNSFTYTPVTKYRTINIRARQLIKFFIHKY